MNELEYHSRKPIYKNNFAREVSEGIAELELQRDRLLIALKGMINVTSGNWKERTYAIKIISGIENE